MKAQEVDAPTKTLTRIEKPFVIPGIRNLKIESQLIQIIVLIIFWKEIPTDWHVQQVWLWPINLEELLSTRY